MTWRHGVEVAHTEGEYGEVTVSAEKLTCPDCGTELSSKAALRKHQGTPKCQEDAIRRRNHALLAQEAAQQWEVLELSDWYGRDWILAVIHHIWPADHRKIVVVERPIVDMYGGRRYGTAHIALRSPVPGAEVRAIVWAAETVGGSDRTMTPAEQVAAFDVALREVLTWDANRIAAMAYDDDESEAEAAATE